jgi:glucokinase
MRDKVYVGLDIGGTNLKASLISSGGEVLGRVHRPSPEAAAGAGKADGGNADIRTALAALVESAAEGKPIAGIGIGCAGVLAADRRIILASPNLRGFEGFPLRGFLEETFGVPTLLENDANAIALGEGWRGAGSGARTLVVVTLGTGVGTGFILDGEVWRGGAGMGGEGGHTTIDPEGPPCRCGNRGCLEAFVGAYGILRRFRDALASGRSSRLAPGPDPRVKEIADTARAGDALASDVLRDTGRYLGVGLANFANLFNPEKIVVTGGVSRAGDAILDPARDEMKLRAFPAVTESLEVLPGRLGDDAGPLGAVYPLIGEGQRRT